jgi:Tfp pilus assembly protein PilO
LLRRILTEHRRVIYPLLVALVLNVVVYAAFVFPLARRVANIEERDRAAEQELAAATRELTRARGIMTGKDRAARELETFYSEVLPANLAGARRLTSLRLQQLAREAGLRAESTGISEDDATGTDTLQALQIDMALTGSYPALRAFIYQLEVAREFVVIDNVQLAEGAEGEGELRITMTLSTYYRRASP